MARNRLKTVQVRKLSKKQLIEFGLEGYKPARYWLFDNNNEERKQWTGPYDTREEAEDDKYGLEAFWETYIEEGFD